MNHIKDWEVYKNNYSNDFVKSTLSINSSDVDNFVKLIYEVKQNGGKIIIAGNGGSASIASHVSVDFTKAMGINTICFSDASLITCFANDYGYEHWLENAIKFYAKKQDLVILISSSGNSMNIINAAEKCKEMNLPLITFSGFLQDNPLRSLGDLNFWVDSKSYNIIEMTHQYWILSAMDFIIFQNNQK
jgi:D-sedoheptulose 7-phosphate isomerase